MEALALNFNLLLLHLRQSGALVGSCYRICKVDRSAMQKRTFVIYDLPVEHDLDGTSLASSCCSLKPFHNVLL